MTDFDGVESSAARSATESRDGRSYLARVVRVFLVGMVGVVGLVVTAALVPGTLPSVPDVPRSVLLVASLLQPAVLVLVASAVGGRLAPAVGFRSYTASGDSLESILRNLRSEGRVAVPAGFGVGVLIVVFDLVFGALTDVDRALVPTEPVSVTEVLATLPIRFLYGGITEEVLLRWGFMTLLVWVLWRVSGRPNRPSSTAVVASIVVAAVVFGIGHLPAVALQTPLTVGIVARTVVLNAVGGIVFGWVYWRYSLEAAMLAHAAAHVALVAPVLLAAV
ncbi:CPBP family glutamic-type intramembrane protease [Haloarchaeobius sp. TZWWS8]|uniref:CPBP family glutamic-type intramembrane protease n=1 Tax=Haloarchaeobius sp. TZWWS8 TaxID=3446121 RepID=UPI003EBAA820